MNNYAYILDGKAYINLTNKCSNACTFCIRNTGDGVKDTVLWLDDEPTDGKEVLAAFDALEFEGREVVFCGYGEPTENLPVLKEVTRELKSRGYFIRLNTNGLGNLVNGRNIAPELKDIDAVSVSLNSCTADKYLAVTRSAFGVKAFDGVLEFARCCKAGNLDVIFTVVDVIGEKDIANCKKLCDNMGIPLRVRKYVADNYTG
ncbi:MAG: TatD family nuclease-associated radical SAM protein [Clostridiales bacterium]|nr:TatD family nuclease-associated radical SAM protein [Clostridiales bacterium]